MSRVDGPRASGDAGGWRSAGTGLTERRFHYPGAMPWEWPVGAVCAFALALIATPAGVSGAVLLLPIQLSVLHVPSPAVTPTNLLFNSRPFRADCCGSGTSADC